MTVTPDELAPELGITPLVPRDWLRATYPHEPWDRWHLTLPQIVAACRRFLLERPNLEVR